MLERRVAEIAGDSADGVIIGSPWFIAKEGAQNKNFVESFRKKYNMDPDQFAAQAYDTMYILAAADAAAQGSLQSVQRQYALGAASYVQQLIAEQAAQQIRINLIAAQAQRLVDSAALYQAMGGGVS